MRCAAAAELGRYAALLPAAPFPCAYCCAKLQPGTEPVPPSLQWGSTFRAGQVAHSINL